MNDKQNNFDSAGCCILRRQIQCCLFLFTLILLSGCKSYSNLSDYKADLISYYHSGKYEREIANVMKDAKAFLVHRVRENDSNLAVVFDVDDTALSNWAFTQDMYLGYNKAAFEEWAKNANAPAIPPVLDFYKCAQTNGVKVFFISAREAHLKSVTEQNLKSAGYMNWDGLFIKPESGPKISTAAFKTEVRQSLEKQGFKIIANVGDQESDLQGGFSEKVFKIPNPFYAVAW